MRHLFVSATEFVYPDVHQYRSGASSASLEAARGSYACGQVLLTSLPEGRVPVAVSWTGDLAELGGEVEAMDVTDEALVAVAEAAPETAPEAPAAEA